MILSGFGPSHLWLQNDWPYDNQITKEDAVNRFLFENLWNCVLIVNNYQWKDLLKFNSYLFTIYKNLCMAILKKNYLPQPSALGIWNLSNQGSANARLQKLYNDKVLIIFW